MWGRIHPDDRERVWGLVQEAIREKRDFLAEFSILLPDGSIKYLEANTHHEFSPLGALLEVICTNVDVTERKYAERALRESERKHRQLIESVPCHFWSVIPDGQPTYVNQRLLDYFGVRFEDRKWDVEVLHPDDVAETESALNHALQTGVSFERVHRLRRADGEYRWHRVCAEPQRDPEGQIVQWHGLSVDIDERKRSEERLRVQHAVAQILAEAATIEEATPRILRAIGEYLGWDVGALWRVDREAGALRCVELWHKSSIEVPEFERVSRELTFVPGLGLPGRVWSSLEPEYVPDVVSDENFPRASIAEREGLHAAFSFPILLGSEVLGVIECFSREIRQPDQELLNMLATIGSQIGQFIERKRAEQALRESERQLYQIIDTVPSFLWSADPAGEPTYVNQRALDYSGMRFDEFKHGGWEAFIHPADFPGTMKAFGHAIATGTPYETVHRLRRWDGEYRWHQARGDPLRDRDGRIIQWYGLAVDVDHARKAEDRLRRSEAYLAEAERISHTGSWALSPVTGRLLYWSEECYRIWGFDPAEGLPDPKIARQRMHPDDRDRVENVAQEARRQKRGYTIEFRIVLPDGTVKYLQTTEHHVFSACGELVEAMGTNVDVTERKRAQDEREKLQMLESNLAHMNRLSVMGELAASLSHEILHPIATARNNARAGIRFLEMNPPNLDETREALACVVRDADRANDIVGRIRNQIKKAPPRKERLDLHEAINEVMVMVRSAIARNGVSASTGLMDGLVSVRGDRVQLQQVLVNLILNAVEAMSSIEGGQRELSIRTEQSHTGGILVTVSDSGPGIDPVNLERVFEPFYTTKNSGVGMGLSICQTIINGHGGRLWMSANEPRGAVFQFTLPAAEEDS